MSLLRGGREAPVSRPDPVRGVSRAIPVGRVKRAMDLTFAFTGVVLAAPLLLVIYAWIRLTSPGPGLFRQVRVGAGRREFVMYKFRTMRTDADPKVHADYVRRLMAGEVKPVDGLYKLDNDARITRAGRFLRRTSLDELPQLLNVLRGDMSLVGPRPVLSFEVELFPDWAARRFEVQPGLTGLWQVSGRNQLTMVQGLRLDLEYVAHQSIWLDLLIMIKTLPAVLGRSAR
ncbi:lipopolysaccharide/colanic/teichoic acid biosynthesis glycosyltransferase [Kribbella sp. VKM Ac-2527]|uniref:Lipopolysaccharide/colanic/teichoic acid biosynthesis glycosyltransferase n=2 Tax=Kribbella caucasensis TaxID=2512215 RepID=A0A4R6KIQ3_9ACTN|nr:lipopolysaccharide/colanic/teichoic acid biosynthesis glycosyltransferase [Kribbella sp. VKM Ac-2527]